jgi:hypothetical protein
MIDNVTIGLWLGLLAPAITWFTLYAISRIKNRSKYAVERNVAKWITIRYFVIMLVITLGSMVARTAKEDFDIFTNAVLQNPSEAVGIVIWSVAFMLLLAFVAIKPPYKRTQKPEEDSTPQSKKKGRRKT